MLRIFAFLVAAIVLARLLSVLPFIGPLFERTGLIGVWIAAILLSWVLTRYGQRALVRRRTRARLRELEAVESPHNQGKIGSLHLAEGRARRAARHLALAAEGEPDVPEWHYRLGCAHLAARRPGEAAAALERAVALDEEYAYGDAQLRRAEALAAAGRSEEALDALATFERNHGPRPESAYRRGRLLRALGRRDEARAAFDEVARLAAQAASYQKREAEVWRLKARVASLF